MLVCVTWIQNNRLLCLLKTDIEGKLVTVFERTLPCHLQSELLRTWLQPHKQKKNWQSNIILPGIASSGRTGPWQPAQLHLEASPVRPGETVVWSAEKPAERQHNWLGSFLHESNHSLMRRAVQKKTTASFSFITSVKRVGQTSCFTPSSFQPVCLLAGYL